PDIANAAISDITWKLTNKGNAAATYAVDLLFNGTLPGRVRKQLIVHRLYTNPVANGCSLVEQPQRVVVANIIDPKLLTQQSATRIRQLIVAQARLAGGVTSPRTAAPEITDNSQENTTVTVGPGEIVYVTVRFYNLDKNQGLGFDPVESLTL